MKLRTLLIDRRTDSTESHQAVGNLCSQTRLLKCIANVPSMVGTGMMPHHFPKIPFYMRGTLSI